MNDVEGKIMDTPPNQRPALDRLSESLVNRGNVARAQGFTSQAEEYYQQLAALTDLRSAVATILSKPAGKGGRRVGILEASALSNALSRVS